MKYQVGDVLRSTTAPMYTWKILDVDLISKTYDTQRYYKEKESGGIDCGMRQVVLECDVELVHSSARQKEFDELWV